MTQHSSHPVRFGYRVSGLAVLGTFAVAAAPAVSAVPDIRVKALPNDRTATVLSVRPRAGLAVVAFPSGRIATIHSSLRSITPGRRVQVEGIKWGTPTSGIKWSKRPQGIKWGIKWSRSGVFQSRLRTIGPAKTARVRGIVVRRFGSGVAVGTPGGIVPIRVAVWLPGIKRTTGRTAGSPIPALGDTVVIDVRFTPSGRLVSTNGVRVVRRANGAALPVSGRVASVSTELRTMTIRNVDDPRLPVVREIRIPTSVDVTRLQLGSEVASTSTLTSDGSLRAATIAPNQSFEASNDPANLIVAPPPANDEVLDLLRRAIDRWVAARGTNSVTDLATYDRGLLHLQTADVAARDGNTAIATTELRAFNDLLIAAVPGKVTPEVTADELALVNAALSALG